MSSFSPPHVYYCKVVSCNGAADLNVPGVVTAASLMGAALWCCRSCAVPSSAPGSSGVTWPCQPQLTLGTPAGHWACCPWGPGAGCSRVAQEIQRGAGKWQCPDEIHRHCSCSCCTPDIRPQVREWCSAEPPVGIGKQGRQQMRSCWSAVSGKSRAGLWWGRSERSIAASVCVVAGDFTQDIVASCKEEENTDWKKWGKMWGKWD